MTRWLQSGLRRDICAIVAAEGAPTETETKTALEDHYGERVRPGQFHGAVDALVRSGHLDREADGLQQQLTISDAGGTALAAHAAWLADCVDEAELEV